MKAFIPAIILSGPKNKWCFCSFFIVFSLICGAYFSGNALIAKEYKTILVLGTEKNIKSTVCEGQSRLHGSESLPKGQSKPHGSESLPKGQSRPQGSESLRKGQSRPHGSASLPKGIIVKQSNLEMQSLWNLQENKRHSKPPSNLLAMAVGIKQKEIVNKIIEKFSSEEFVVMLFHYDGIVDGWRDFSWSDNAIHVSAMNQTKWWFAKRFLHPDIVADYNYIFLWDEDLGVENFDPQRYISIVEEEGLEISQPALDRRQSTLNHHLTARRTGSRVHRMYHKLTENASCDGPNINSPYIGWVEMMAPVFSRKSWPCVWHMIQNDLIHAWGLDRKLGYCAQGDSSRNVGIVDAEYIVHFGLPTLGGSKSNQGSHRNQARTKVRMESYREMETFKRRWKNAMKKDKCWTDPYAQLTNQNSP